MMARFGPFIGATCAAVLPVATAPGPYAAGDANLTHPLVIICEREGEQHFAYLDRIAADGTATYMTPSGQFATVPAGGVFGRGGQADAGSCAGKTLEEMRAAGQTLPISG